jgi:hypothetical protein
MKCLEFERPKLGVVATINLSTDDFATMLDKAIMRSQVKLIEHRQDEVAKPAQPAPRTGPITDRRFRRA